MANILVEKNKIRKRRDFSKVYKKGQSVIAPSVVLCYKKNHTDVFRCGFTVSKKVGKAVERNKVRRRMREISRTHLDYFQTGMDYIFVARKKAAQVEFSVLQKDMLQLVKRTKRE